MSLADDLANEVPVRKGPPCSVSTLLRQLDADDRAAVQAALDGPQSHAHIARTLRKHGHPIGDNTIQRHRRAECACGRETQ